MVWCLLPPLGPSQILPVSFWWQHPVPYRDLLLGTTHASGYYHAWPRQAVSVNGSLTETVGFFQV